MRTAFIGFLIMILNVAIIVGLIFVEYKEKEIVEIQSPPLFVFVNAYKDKIENFKNNIILQKVLSETKIYGRSPFLLKSMEKLNEVEYFLKVFSVDFNEKVYKNRYWWGSSTYKIVKFGNSIFYYRPYVIVSSSSNNSFGKALLGALKGKSYDFKISDLNSISVEILKKYGVELYEE